MNQLLGSLSSTDGDADARRGAQPVPIMNIGGGAQLLLEAFGDPCRCAGVRDVLEHDGELVPPIRAAISSSRKQPFNRSATSRSTPSPS